MRLFSFLSAFSESLYFPFNQGIIPFHQFRNDFTVYQERKAGANNIEHITLQDLFSLISDNEYQEYKSYVKKFNEDIRKLFGYRTIVVPSESSLNEMKAGLFLAANRDRLDPAFDRFEAEIRSIRGYAENGINESNGG